MQPATKSSKLKISLSRKKRVQLLQKKRSCQYVAAANLILHCPHEPFNENFDEVFEWGILFSWEYLMIRRNPSGVLLIVSGKRTKYLMMENEILGWFSEFCRFQKSRFKNTFSFNSILQRNIAKGTTNPRHFRVLWLILHVWIKAETPTSFEILVKLFFWKMVRNT